MSDDPSVRLQGQDPWTADSIKLLETLASECDTLNEHKWRTCPRCLAVAGVEGGFKLSIRLLRHAAAQLKSQAEVIQQLQRPVWIWHPIETARDYDTVIVFDPRIGRLLGYLRDGVWTEPQSKMLLYPTHWMPLPDPPAPPPQKGQP